MKHLRVAGVLASCAVAWTGCKKEAPPAPPPAPPPAAASAPPPPPPEPRADPECAAALTETPAAEVQVAGRKATSTGAKLVFADADADGEWTLGVLGPINEDSGANLIALQKYLKFFADEKVDAIAVSGDVGEVADGIARALTALGEAKVPVLVIAGNRECKADFIKGVERASATSGSVVNMNRVRSVEFPGAMVISLPGYHDPNYITCKTGCRYYKSTVDEVVTLAKASTRPAVLLAHGPFQGEGSQAIDHAVSGGNVGNPELNRALEEGTIPFGVFSNIKEAGARATDRTGSTLVKPGAWSPALYLNPGPADTARWDMNDGSKGVGFAAVLKVKGKEGSWKLYRAKAPTPAEKSQAKALEPPARPEAAEDGAELAGQDAGTARPTPPPGRPLPSP